MRINVFGPLPPAPTEIAQHLLRILPDLAAACDLTLWTSAPDWDKSLTRHAPVIAYNPATIATDPRARSGHNVYNIGNSIDLHGDIWEAARAIPGTLVLHDASFFAYVWGYFRIRHPSRDRLIESLRTHDGDAAVQDDEAYERGAVPLGEMCRKYPQTNLICANATSVLLHNEAVRATLSLPPHIPVAVATPPSAAPACAGGSAGQASPADAHTPSGYVAGLLALCAEAREEAAPASRHLLDRIEREHAFLGPASRCPGFLVGLGNAIADVTPGKY